MSVPRAGISYSPFLEWRLAAKWANYTPEEFDAIDGERQAFVVATYRVSNQIEAVLSKDADDKAKRKSGK